MAPGVSTPHEISGFMRTHPLGVWSGVGLGAVDCHWVSGGGGEGGGGGGERGGVIKENL